VKRRDDEKKPDTYKAKERKDYEELEEVTENIPFLFLSVDIPPRPLFKEEQDKNIIPQVPLFTLLNKYNGVDEQPFVTGERKKYTITKLPRYLILQVKRFTKNNWYIEKNPTIVNFPISNLDLKDYVADPEHMKTKYDLVANIRHESPHEKKVGSNKALDARFGQYSVHVQNKADEQWYEVQDLRVEPIIRHLITVSEAYVQIYEQKQ